MCHYSCKQQYVGSNLFALHRGKQLNLHKFSQSSCEWQTDERGGGGLITVRFPQSKFYLEILAVQIFMGSESTWGCAILLNLQSSLAMESPCITPHPLSEHCSTTALPQLGGILLSPVWTSWSKLQQNKAQRSRATSSLRSPNKAEDFRKCLGTCWYILQLGNKWLND